MYPKNNSFLTLAASAAFIALLMIFVAPSFVAGLPTETTRINEVRLYDENAALITEFTVGTDIDTADVGTFLSHAVIRVRISKDYAVDVTEARENTRAYLTVINTENENIIDNELGSATYITTMIDYYLVPFQFDVVPAPPIYPGVYSVIATYEILLDGVWTHADAGTYYMTGVYPIPVDAATWLPIMMSFGVIAGMGFVGMNLSARHDPMPGIFMLFVGVAVTWSIGWLPGWVFVTAVALVSLVGAALWRKPFGKGGD